MIELKGIDVYFNKGTKIENHALKSFNLKVEDGQFVTIIGGNGAGKSTLMNLVAGKIFPTNGQIFIDNTDVTKIPQDKRAGLIARVFQDPRIGTFTDLTIEENMAIASKRGEYRLIDLAITSAKRAEFAENLKDLGIGLEERMQDKVSSLSGGQRQALSLVMATLRGSKLLLLDEHTAALDPKIARSIMKLTSKIVKQQKLTALMITHSMTQALEFGNRTLMMYHGEIVRDMNGDERRSLSTEDLLKYFEF